MKRDEVSKRLLFFVEDNIDYKLDQIQKITYDTELLTHGILDSMNIIKLISFIESEFALSIEPLDFGPKDIVSINSLTTYVINRL